MANRYWVGGTGTWDASSTTHWSASSGGASGASVPTSADDVYFDANSGGGTVNKATTPLVNSLSFSGFAGTISGVGQINFGGNLDVGTSGTALTSTVAFAGQHNAPGTFSIGGTRTCYSIALFGSSDTATINQTSALSIVGDDLTIQRAGPFNTNNYAINARVAANAIGAGDFNFGTSSISSFATILTDGSGSVYYSGTITPASGSLQVFVGGSGSIYATLPSVYTTLYYGKTGSGSVTFPTSINATSVTVNGGTLSSTVVCSTLSISTYLSVPGAVTGASPSTAVFNLLGTGGTIGTFGSYGSSTEIIVGSDFTISNMSILGPAGTTTVRSDTAGVQRTITSTSYSLSNISWKDINAAGTIPFTGTGFVDLGNNTNIQFTLPWNGLFFGSNF